MTASIASTPVARPAPGGSALSHSWYMTVRHVRALLRQPWYVVITLVQPVIWLLLFGALFERMTLIPGFGGGSYIEFLTPGVVVMSALFSNGWSGMGVIEDIDRGVMDRLLVSPVRRSALLNGRLVQQAIITIVQSLIIVGLAWLVGARFAGGFVGVLVLVAAGVLLGAAFASASHALALVVRREESVIAASQFVVLPTTFLSSAYLPPGLAPDWIQAIARYNPVNWALEAGRSALAGGAIDWPLVLSRLGGLLAVAMVCAVLAARAFRSYQRSV
jgi:ABC-2 type transport system permease protein